MSEEPIPVCILGLAGQTNWIFPTTRTNQQSRPFYDH
jgi:Glycosyl transferase family 64 domain